MSFAKYSKFKEADVYPCLIFKAMSHPARLLIIRLLLNPTGEAVEHKEFKKHIPINPSTLSDHISYLRHRGVIISYWENNNYFHKLDRSMYATLVLLFRATGELPEDFVEEAKWEIQEFLKNYYESPKDNNKG